MGSLRDVPGDAMRIIPAIDIKDGRCVRLFQGDYSRSTEYSKVPGEIARRFSSLPVRDLHLVDLDGARSGEQVNADIIRSIASESGLAIQLGGGLRDSATLAQWFEAGVERCVVGSAAVRDPARVSDWFAQFGAEKIVLALDVVVEDDAAPRLATDGWTRTSTTSLWDCIETFAGDGLAHLLCTDISRDGAMTGPNTDLYRQIMQRYPTLQLQASGGIRHADDLEALQRAGIPAAITGRALLDGKISDEEIAAFLPNA